MTEDTDVGERQIRRAGRPPGARHQRTPVREEQVREAARAPEGETRLRRRRKREEDRFFISEEMKREYAARGMSIEWKRESVYGRPDIDHIANLQDNHWSPVPANRHSGFVTKKDGMILMERPKYLTDEARQEDYQIAADRVRSVGAQISSTPDGTMTRDHPSVRANTKVNRTYEPMPIPEN